MNLLKEFSHFQELAARTESNSCFYILKKIRLTPQGKGTH